MLFSENGLKLPPLIKSVRKVMDFKIFEKSRTARLKRKVIITLKLEVFTTKVIL